MFPVIGPAGYMRMAAFGRLLSVATDSNRQSDRTQCTGQVGQMQRVVKWSAFSQPSICSLFRPFKWGEFSLFWS